MVGIRRKERGGRSFYLMKSGRKIVPLIFYISINKSYKYMILMRYETILMILFF